MEREFDPFVLQWKYMAPFVILADQHDPGRKVDYWMNRRMRDWKHRTRQDRDHSRVSPNRVIHYRNPEFASLYGAARANDPAILADSALYISNVVQRYG